MSKIEYKSNTSKADAERSSEAIREDIAKGEEDISKTVEQIGDRLKEKLDWREHVKDSPYLALGVAAGVGLLASAILRPRTTPTERMMQSIADDVHDVLGGLRTQAAGAGLIKVTVLGIAAKVAAGWIKNSIVQHRDCAAPDTDNSQDAF